MVPKARVLAALAPASLVFACSGSSGSDVADGGATSTSRPDFVSTCDQRTAAEAGSCPHTGKCDALYTCIQMVVEPGLQARVLECETNACTPDGKRDCLDKAAQTVTDANATGWAATCDDRADTAGVSDDACHKGAAALSAAYRAEFDRCVGLTKAEAADCVSRLNAPCESTYF